jgi:flagellar biogenesis protein FliO
MTKITIIIIAIIVIVAIVWGVRRFTKKVNDSPSIVGGGYDQKMAEKEAELNK